MPSLCKIWRGGGWFPAGNHCHDTSHQQVPSRHATPGSCLRFPSTGRPPSCLLAKTPGILQMPWHPFPRSLNLTIALFIAALSWVWRSCRSFFPRCAWRARESFVSTRGTTPTHTPPTPRLVWLSSISLSDWVANGSSHCSRCPTPPPPRPPLSSPPLSVPPPPPPPSSCSRLD